MVLGGLTVNEWLSIAGFILAVGTFLVNYFHKKRDSKMKQDFLNRRLEILEKRGTNAYAKYDHS